MESETTATATINVRKAAFRAANIAEAKKGVGTLILDVKRVTLLADYFVVTGGESAPQVRAIAEAINEGLSDYGYQPRSIEGKKEARWVLLDYGDIIIHVLQDKERGFYKLEQFWNQALVVNPKEWAESVHTRLQSGRSDKL